MPDLHKMRSNVDGSTSHATSKDVAWLPAVLEASWRFARFWRRTFDENVRAILILTAANVALTFFNEFSVRFLFTKFFGVAPTESFFLREAGGGVFIHKQSMINIMMTLFLSLAGGPIYYFRRVRHRFAFFMMMAALMSAMSQIAVGFAFSAAALSMNRLVFDLAYNAGIKYPVFEGGRPWLLKFRRSFIGVIGVRYTQDFAMAIIRIGLIILLGLENS